VAEQLACSPPLPFPYYPEAEGAITLLSMRFRRFFEGAAGRCAMQQNSSSGLEAAATERRQVIKLHLPLSHIEPAAEICTSR
jgi:hypothetical protein